MNTNTETKRNGRFATGTTGTACRHLLYRSQTFLQHLSVPGILAFSGCLLLILSPEVSVAAAKRGMDLWWNAVVPSMLPFFICTDLLTSAGGHRFFGKIMQRPVQFLLGVPGSAGFVFAASLFSGYPTGAKIIGQLVREGSLTRKKGQEMLNFCTTSGPLFMVGAVGVGMLGDSRAGFQILAAHSLGALLTGLLLNPGSIVNRPQKKPERTGAAERRRKTAAWGVTDTAEAVRNGGTTERQQRARSTKQAGGTAADRLMDLLSGAIFRSLGTLGLIGGFLVIFCILSAYTAGTIRWIAAVCDLPRHLTQALSAVLPGFLEMTVGCSNAAEIPFWDLEHQTVWCSFLISFGGFSVMAQTAGVLQGTGLSIKKYLGAKLLHGLNAALIAEILVLTAPF